jgi:hypothetical protein
LSGLDPAANPYAPGAGTRPPLLAGRDDQLNDARRTIARARLGYSDQPRLAVGVRGVGKTVLLLAVRDQARREDGVAVHVQARRGQSVVSALLRELEFELRRRRPVRAGVDRALKTVSSLAVTAGGISVETRRGAETFDLDLAIELLNVFTAVARAAEAPFVLTVDELQEVPRNDLSALLVALQRAGGEGLPMVAVAAGLPGVLAEAARVESFAERLFAVWQLGPLDQGAARSAVVTPARDAGGVEWDDDAAQHLVQAAAGYPFYLQHFAAAVWNVALGSPITVDDVALGVERAEALLADSLVRARVERLSARERDYVMALAALGPGDHGSGDVAAVLGVDSPKLGSARQRLAAAGIVYSPARGRVAFTLPMFDRYVRDLTKEA